MSNKPSLSYKDAGVDIDAGDALVQRIKSGGKPPLVLRLWADLAALERFVVYQLVTPLLYSCRALTASVLSSSWRYS